MLDNELVKFLLLMPFLLYATWSDLKTMTVSNKFVKILLVAVIIIVLSISYNDPILILSTTISTILIFLIMFGMFILKIVGGADAKILTIVAILFPHFVELRNIFPFYVFDILIGSNPNAAMFMSVEIPFIFIVYINATFISGLSFVFMLRKYKMFEIAKNFGNIKVPFVPFIMAGFIITFMFVNKILIFGQ